MPSLMKARPSTRRQSHLLERAARPQPLAPNGQISTTKHHISKDLGGIPHHLLISHKGLDRYGAQTRPAPAAWHTQLSTRLSIAPLLDPHMPSNHAHPTLSLSHAVMLLRLFFLTRAPSGAHARHPRPLLTCGSPCGFGRRRAARPACPCRGARAREAGSRGRGIPPT